MAGFRFVTLAAASALLAFGGCNLVTGADDLVVDPALGGTTTAGAGGTATGLPQGGAAGTGAGEGGAGASGLAGGTGGVGALGGSGGTGATGGTGGTAGTGGGGACTGATVPDFSLTDVNTTSATYNTDVSPRDYLQQISAWYFGNAL